MKTTTDMGNRIKKLRVARDWTQQELADRAGVSKQAVSFWETNRNPMSREKLQTLCELFNVDVDYLLCREDMTSRLLNSEELAIVDAYRMMTDSEKDMICRMFNVKRDVKSTDSLKEA